MSSRGQKKDGKKTSQVAHRQKQITSPNKGDIGLSEYLWVVEVSIKSWRIQRCAGREMQDGFHERKISSLKIGEVTFIDFFLTKHWFKIQIF